jgi:hypothetical protein
MDRDRLETIIWTFFYLALQKWPWGLDSRPKKIHLKICLPTHEMLPTLLSFFYLPPTRKQSVSSRNPRTIPTIQDFYHLGASVGQNI